MLKYLKTKNEELFKSLENLDEEYGSMEKNQSYIPLYKKIFVMGDKDHEDTVLVSKEILNEIKKINETSNNFNCNLLDISTNEITNKDIFIKFSPIMNITRYLTGKYDKDDSIFNLPNYNNDNSHEKILDDNNSSYTDSFFNYISSFLLNEYNMFHGLNYYGSFLGIKNDYKINIGDDLEYLIESQYFLDNIDNHFTLTGDIDKVNEVKSMNNISKKYKSKIKINEDWKDNENEPMIEDIIDFEDVFNHDKVGNNNELEELTVFNINEEVIDDTISLNSNDSNSSGTIDTGELSSEDEEWSTEDEDEDEEDDDDSDDSEYIDVNAVINKFPVQLICMENCKNTFDSLIENNFSKDEWTSSLFQIVMILVVYQKVLWFTHNDLHSNNIMYQETSKKFLFYKYKDVYYKVPTYGRIYKIIDFGRSIYKFKNYLYCSDAYKKGEDASSQYNFGPYYDKKKKELMPNFSFDLCRLACSIFDNIFTFNMVEEYSQNYIETKCKKDEVAKLINEWCKDDKGRNILYTSEGDERYPEFKLYKMISRTVNNVLPEKEIQKEIFKKYIVNKKSIKNNLRDKNVLLLDVDEIPKMYSD